MTGGPGGGGSAKGIKSSQDLLCGVLFVLMGGFLLWVARDYSMGSPVRLGTGVFPTLLCWGLVISGAIIIVQALLTDGERLTPWAWRPVIMITIGTILFSVLIDRLGLLVAMTALMICGAVAGKDHKWGQTVIFMLIMIVIGYGLFIWGLGMPIPFVRLP